MEELRMTNRRTLTFSIFAAAVLALCLPMLATAQGRYDPWGRNGNYGRYDERYVRDSIHRLDRLAKDFEKEVDRSLDRSRRDGTRREDQINARANQFRDAVGDLKSEFGNGRDLNRSRDEAQRVFQEARQIERVGLGMGRGSNGRIGSLWSQIRQELNVISNVYGNYGYDNGGYYPNGRNRTNNNNDWWNRIPWPNR